MKIILVNRHFFPDRSPISRLLSDLAFHLAALGREVHVVTSRMRLDNSRVTLKPYEEIYGVHIHRVWTSRFGSGLLLGRGVNDLTFHQATERKLLKLVSKGDRVVVKSDPPMLTSLVAGVSYRRNAVQINWLHEIFPEIAIAAEVHGLSGWFGRQLRTLSTRTFRSSFVNIVPGESMRRTLVEERVIPPDRVRVIRDWTDGREITPSRTDEENPLRDEWGLRGKFVLAYVGRIERTCEYHAILDAADRLRGEREIRFLFIGEGSQLNTLKKDARKHNLGNLLFKPPQEGERLRWSLLLPDIHLLSTHAGAEGYILPEGFYRIAAAGKPLIYIGDKQGEVAHWIQLARIGTSVGTREGLKLARRILVMRLAPERLERMGENARKLYRARFSSGRALAKWIELLGLEDPSEFSGNGDSENSGIGFEVE